MNVETLVACYEDEHPKCDGSHDVTTDDVQKHSTTDDTLLILCDECGCREVDRVEFEARHPEIDESFIERLGPGAERLRETTDWDTYRLDEPTMQILSGTVDVQERESTTPPYRSGCPLALEGASPKPSSRFGPLPVTVPVRGRSGEITGHTRIRTASSRLSGG